MNKKLLTLIATVGLSLTTTSCMYKSTDPTAYHGDHADTMMKSINVDSADVQLRCARAVGKSQGFKILGIIPVRLASETEAVNNMYQNARDRGAAPEGIASHFVNHSYEYKSNYRFLYSTPEIRATADLVEILPPGKGMDTLIARGSASKPAAAPTKPAPAPAPKKKRR